jgi:MFS family permease
MDQSTGIQAFLRSRWGIGAIAFLAIAALLLVFDHWSHIFESNLILGVLLLACVGMHFFMHAGHDGHGNHSKDDQ